MSKIIIIGQCECEVYFELKENRYDLRKETNELTNYRCPSCEKISCRYELNEEKARVSRNCSRYFMTYKKISEC